MESQSSSGSANEMMMRLTAVMVTEMLEMW